MTTHNEERDVFNSHCFDPFPEPQTMPAGWDLSSLLPMPETASTTTAEDSTENESA